MKASYSAVFSCPLYTHIASKAAMGSLTVALARALARRGQTVDASALLERLLIDAVVDACSESWSEDMVDALGGPLDVVIDMVSVPDTLAGGQAALGRAGTFVVVGFHPDIGMQVQPAELVLKELVVTGTRYATRAEIAQALDLVRSGAVRCVVGARFPLEKAQDAMDAIARNEVFGRILIDCADPSAPD
jgi:D-arabinose 1-dehydrogenase-like Zn-dependent alcohol dehydrogenase